MVWIWGHWWRNLLDLCPRLKTCTGPRSVLPPSVSTQAKTRALEQVPCLNEPTQGHTQFILFYLFSFSFLYFPQLQQSIFYYQFLLSVSLISFSPLNSSYISFSMKSVSLALCSSHIYIYILFPSLTLFLFFFSFISVIKKKKPHPIN